MREPGELERTRGDGAVWVLLLGEELQPAGEVDQEASSRGPQGKVAGVLSKRP